MAGSWRNNRPIPKGRCRATPGCPNPPVGYYCARHQALSNKNQNAGRRLRVQLGFCIYCMARAEPGHTRCAKHLKATREHNQTERDREAEKRGWKMMRVPVGRAADGQRRAGGTR